MDFCHHHENNKISEACCRISPGKPRQRKKWINLNYHKWTSHRCVLTHNLMKTSICYRLPVFNQQIVMWICNPE